MTHVLYHAIIQPISLIAKAELVLIDCTSTRYGGKISEIAHNDTIQLGLLPLFDRLAPSR